MRPDRQPKLRFSGDLAKAMRQLGIHLRHGTKICAEYAPEARPDSRGRLCQRQACKLHPSSES